MAHPALRQVRMLSQCSDSLSKTDVDLLFFAVACNQPCATGTYESATGNCLMCSSGFELTYVGDGVVNGPYLCSLTCPAYQFYVPGSNPASCQACNKFSDPGVVSYSASSSTICVPTGCKLGYGRYSNGFEFYCQQCPVNQVAQTPTSRTSDFGRIGRRTNADPPLPCAACTACPSGTFTGLGKFAGICTGADCPVGSGVVGPLQCGYCYALGPEMYSPGGVNSGKCLLCWCCCVSKLAVRLNEIFSGVSSLSAMSSKHHTDSRWISLRVWLSARLCIQQRQHMCCLRFRLYLRWRNFQYDSDAR